jgi:hypothetical protein
LYFSRGSLKGCLRIGDSVCPDAVASETMEASKISCFSRLAVSRRLRWVVPEHGDAAPLLQLKIGTEVVVDFMECLKW